MWKEFDTTALMGGCMLPISLRFGWIGGGEGRGIEPKNKQRTIYVERVRHYSIDGCMHVVPTSLRFGEGGGVVMRMGTQQYNTIPSIH